MYDIPSRRDFLGASASAISAAAGTGAKLALAAPAAGNAASVEKLNVGFIGLGGQGRFLLERFQANPRVRIAALSDCYQERMDRAQKLLSAPAAQFRDFRKLLDRNDLDAVVIGSPDHWHCLMSMLACDSGKDVYVEKPLSLCIDEGRRLVQAARRHRRIVQVGLMQRSGALYQQAVDVVRSGELGKISVVKAWNIYNRIGAKSSKRVASVPHGLDWDLWLGPRPQREYDPLLTSGGFRWVWDFGGGNITDRGTHTFDTILQAMEARHPKRVSAVGGRYVFNEPDEFRETPDTLNVLYDFGDWTLHYEAREANHRVQWPSGYGFVFYGTKGSLFVDRGGYRTYRERNRTGLTGEDKVVGTPGKGQVTGIHELFDPHIENFVECIATRNLPVCDVELGHLSSNVAHLGNMAYRLQREIVWNGESETCVDDEEAQRLTQRQYRSPWRLPDTT